MATNRESFPVEFKGGLVTNLSPLQQGINMPGSAATLKNFEPSITGGYKRILGFTKFDPFIIPPYGSPVVFGASQTGTTFIIAATHTSPAAGDTLTIAGVSGTYTVSTIAAFDGPNNRTTLTLATSLASSPANGAAVTFVSTDAVYRTLGVEVFNDTVLVALNNDLFKTTGSGYTKINVPSYGTVLVNGASQTGATVAVDALSSAPQAGDIFTIAGVDKVYTVLANATVSSGGSTLSINPTLASSPADNAAITFISLSREGALRTRFNEYNFTGTSKVSIVDGINSPAIFDGSTFTDLIAAPSDVIGATQVIDFKNHIFYGKLDILSFTAPFLDTNFEAGDGAGNIRVGDKITGLAVFREQLIIFTERTIFKLTGVDLSTFALTPITLDIGCIDGDTIQEIGGDVMFLTGDGLRLLSATDRIGDFGLGVVSKTIQNVMTDFIASASIFTSVVIRSKSQYRVFSFNPNSIGASAKGIIGTQFSPQGGEDMAWAEIRGIEVFAASSKLVDSIEVIVFSSDTGFVFKMEDGNSFDNTDITAEYLSPYLPLNDPRTRKTIYKVYLYTDPVGSVNFDFNLKFDYDELNSVQPESISFTNATSAISFYGDNNFATYATTASGSSGATSVTVASNTNMVIGNKIIGTGIPTNTTITDISGTTITISAALTATISNVRVTSGGSVFGGKVQNIFSTQTVGTGFTTAISFKSTSQDPPFSLDTAMLEYATKSRR
tara:strand:- start:374 stop:2548 length:2175 start_codon:yes stop_codon:yes gene_type:complete